MTSVWLEIVATMTNCAAWLLVTFVLHHCAVLVCVLVPPVLLVLAFIAREPHYLTDLIMTELFEHAHTNAIVRVLIYFTGCAGGK